MLRCLVSKTCLKIPDNLSLADENQSQLVWGIRALGASNLILVLVWSVLYVKHVLCWRVSSDSYGDTSDLHCCTYSYFTSTGTEFIFHFIYKLVYFNTHRGLPRLILRQVVTKYTAASQSSSSCHTAKPTPYEYIYMWVHTCIYIYTQTYQYKLHFYDIAPKMAVFCIYVSVLKTLWELQYAHTV